MCWVVGIIRFVVVDCSVEVRLCWICGWWCFICLGSVIDFIGVVFE